MIPYVFEVSQHITVKVYDSDGSSRDLSKHDFVGSYSFCMADLLTAMCQTLEAPLYNRDRQGKQCGSVRVVGEERVGDSRALVMSLSAQGLPKMDTFGRCDGYLQFYRIREGNADPVLVAKTEVIKSNYNPSWNTLQVSLGDLVNGDRDRPFIIKCYDYDMVGEHDLVGSITCTLNELAHAATPETGLMLVNDENRAKRLKKGKAYKGEGKIYMREGMQEITVPSMPAYLGAGLEISLSVAIDFTGSNGHPSSAGSLHYRTQTAPSRYEKAIHAVGSVLLPYDSDQIVRASVFGAGVPGQGTQHALDIANGDGVNLAEGPGLMPVLQAYVNALQQFNLSGPTLFAPILKSVNDAAQQQQIEAGGPYHVLLLLTDGVICDRQQTIDEIVRASSLPVSVVIVGIGNADFSEMDELDADTQPLISSKGVRTERDAVQFVPFTQFENNPNMLAQETLKEMPAQIVQFLTSRGISPDVMRNYHAQRQYAQQQVQQGGVYQQAQAQGGYPGDAPAPAPLNDGVYHQ
ncbi:hypothetical protein KIPB_002606 [Kipferlia bialata]|uniref:C2 domain-containing protein n=1 Tax=Kipferlia bialata TaxID=797122 RepID=A0A9K3CS09_9EUKA|nr:hypothetical protein KIPB_002606 [Kipferlia bialata]|eukprot:g2606.t1